MKRLLILLLTAMLLLTACTSADKQPRAETGPTEPDEEYGEDYSESWRERPIPEAFDLRSVDTDGDGKGDRCFVPPVRNQRPFGSCWGFSATGAAEISILGSILKNDPDAWKTINLSEKQMVYFSHMPLSDPENPQNGEGDSPILLDSDRYRSRCSAGRLRSFGRNGPDIY